jgi:hypothetical protein
MLVKLTLGVLLRHIHTPKKVQALNVSTKKVAHETFVQKAVHKMLVKLTPRK